MVSKRCRSSQLVVVVMSAAFVLLVSCGSVLGTIDGIRDPFDCGCPGCHGRIACCQIICGNGSGQQGTDNDVVPNTMGEDNNVDLGLFLEPEYMDLLQAPSSSYPSFQMGPSAFITACTTLAISLFCHG